MPTGDPMWMCTFCGKTHYSLVSQLCGCPHSLRRANDVFLQENETFENMNNKHAEVGIIVGRFQTPFLHEGHLEILSYVMRKHPRMFVFLGQSPLKSTINDPLDFNARKAMIEEKFPSIEVYKIDDVGDNDRWSRELDTQIGLLTGPFQTVVLYGSRSSFLQSYRGKHGTEELKASRYVSATEIRKETGIRSQKTREFREGAVWAMQNQYPKVYATVDMAALDLTNRKVLLGRKPAEVLFRFPGGFADVNSESYEEDAVRELKEETGLRVAGPIEYIGSTVVDDWRYRNQEDKIKTMFFAIPEWTGIPTGDDDLADVKWFDFESLFSNPEQVVPTHRVLLTMLQNWLGKNAYLHNRLKEPADLTLNAG
jgi:bifunctional NMN adenylyltransferase/nudix hydrolase